MTATELLRRNSAVTVLQQLDAWAAEQPDQTALIYLANGEAEQGRLTYAELRRAALGVSHQLLALDACGKTAMLLYPPGLDFVCAFLGCLYAGVIAIPVYAPKTNRNQYRLSGIISDSGARLALSTGAEIQRWRDNDIASEGLASLHWQATDILAGMDSVSGCPSHARDSIALLQYSSGSTGMPKGVMVSHGNLVHNLDYMRQTFRVEADCLSLSWLPIFHDMGLVLGLLEPLFAGIPCVLMPPAAFTQKPLRWLQAITRYRATHSSAPNFAYDLCLRRISPAEREDLDLSSWRVALNGAEPVRRSTMDEFNRTFAPHGLRKQVICPAYGLAEATLVVTGKPAQRDSVYLDVDSATFEHHRAQIVSSNGKGAHALVGCGYTGVDMDYKIVDPATCRVLPSGQVGEIWASSGSVCLGYWNRSQETEYTFKARLAGTEGPNYLRTGDLGFTYDGVLYVTGRMKDLIIIRGRNLYPQDIEFTAEKCDPALRAGFGAAFSISVTEEERLVVAYELERVALRTMDQQRIVEDVRKAILEEYEIRAHDIVLLRTGTIPKTTSGKIQRSACRMAYLAGELEIVSSYQGQILPPQKSAPSKPDSLTAKTVSIVSTFIWQACGRQVFVTPDSRIRADLSLDSLDVTVLLATLERELKITFSINEMPALDTVNDLVTAARAASSAGAARALDATSRDLNSLNNPNDVVHAVVETVAGMVAP